MKKKARYILFALLLVGCTARDSSQEVDRAVQVQFAVPTIGVEVGYTRSASSLAAGTTVRVLAFRRAGSDMDLKKDEYAGTGTYRVADGSGTLTPVIPLVLRPETYDFYLLTPQLDVTATADAGNASYTVAVAHHLDYADSRVSSIAVSESNPTVAFPALTRRCSMLTFALSPLGNNITAAEVTKASLTQMTDAPVVTPLGSGLDVSTTPCKTSVDLTDFEAEDSQKPLDLSSSTPVLPRRAGAFGFYLSVKFNGSSEATNLSASLPADIAFAPGTRYVFTVKLKGDGAELTLTIAPWSSNNHEADMGGANVVELKVGEWTDVHWNTGQGSTGGGNTSLVISGWQPNASWSDDLGRYPLLGIVCNLWEDISWMDKPNTGGGNAGLTPGDWNNGEHVTNDANGGSMGGN